MTGPMLMSPAPTPSVPVHKGADLKPGDIDRTFQLERRVTSVDITADGCYVVVGCSDGSIMLFSMVKADANTWGHTGVVLGQIHAKGLITNLIFHVEIAGQFAFAGVLRGSVEMFAYDLSRLPSGMNRREAIRKGDVKHLVDCFTNQDPKLRGFGAAAKMHGTNEYRLFCGLGIKNLHIWSFRPWGGDNVVWECIADRPTNGMSIEFLAARQGGMEAVSKSNGQCVRVWDTNATASSPGSITNSSPSGSSSGSGGSSYKDIPNTQDAKAVFSDFAFGGDCQLALVNLDPSLGGAVNRSELALPQPSSSGQQGARHKRRLLCTVKQVIGTHDGSHVVVVLSDGSVLYYEKEDKEALTVGGKLLLLPALAIPEDEDCSLTLASVGGNDLVAVITSRWLPSENRGEINIEPLCLKADPDAAPRKALSDLDMNKVSSGGTTQGTDKPTAKKTLPSAPPDMSRQGSSGSGAKEGDDKVVIKKKKGPKPDKDKDKDTNKQVGDVPSASTNGGEPRKKSYSKPPKPSKPPPPTAPPSPVKRKHYDPFAGHVQAAAKKARKTGTVLAPPRPMPQPVSMRVHQFLDEQAERRRTLESIRESMEASRRAELRQHVYSSEGVGKAPSVSVVRTWSQLKAEHERQLANLSEGFRAEHDWLRLRFLEAVEAERVIQLRDSVPPGPWLQSPADYINRQQTRLPFRCKASRSSDSWASSDSNDEDEEFDMNPWSIRLARLVNNYKEMAAMMVQRQQMEANTLLSMQTLELPYSTHSTRPIKIDYPYKHDWAMGDPVLRHRLAFDKPRARITPLQTTNTATTTTTTTKLREDTAEENQTHEIMVVEEGEVQQ